MNKSPAAYDRIIAMDTAKLARLSAFWDACSLMQLDNWRSPYHVWAIRAKLELLRRQEMQHETVSGTEV